MNNLEKRIERHLRREKRKHRHIDHALEHGIPVAVILIESRLRIEEQLSKLLTKHFHAVTGFGASDVKTKSNLFAVESLEELLGVISIEFPISNVIEYRISIDHSFLTTDSSSPPPRPLANSDPSRTSVPE